MKYLVYLHTIGISQKKLLEFFKENEDYKKIFEDIKKGKFEKYNIFEKEKIKEKLEKLDTKKIDKILDNLGVKIVTIKDKNYPKNLKEISNSPYFLYIRGNLKENEEFFGIVGSRKILPYAKQVGENIIPELANYFNIVSGGAGGCDSLAHEICVENNYKTTVIFGTGIDITYPVYNEKLFEEVLRNDGCLISIFPIGTTGNIYTFPIRNEIVAGMSKGILILQAKEKSGTLITANLALDQGKDVFAIPGDIFKEDYAGCNNLIKNGNAKLVSNALDILEEYNFKSIKKEIQISFSNETEKFLYELLKYNLSLSIDEIIEKSGLDYFALSNNLSMMEINGIIKKDIIGKYCINY